MTASLPTQFKDPDLRTAAVALERAGRRALELSLQTGTPCLVMEDGQIIDLTKRHRKSSHLKKSSSKR